MSSRRRNWTIVFVLLGIVALALAIVGTIAVIQSMNGTLHVERDKPTATAVAAAPVDEEEAAKQAAEKAARGLTVGAALTAEQAKTIAHDWQGNLLPYKMADGSQVLIARDQPLPENVKVDAGKRLAASADAGEAASDPTGALIEQRKKELEYTLGHKISVVVHAYLALSPAFETLGRAWISTEFGGDQQYATAEECLAAVRAKVGPDATVIVGQ
ncbi:hypothetical protein ACFVWR_07070 [Leifsonia sp. NPDC058292]|uniref:hypothetical protein n=1 Tax=Leifsonia sp. NPDC058292 TaxID=3346428 RepID=UPI0036DEB786